MTERISSPRNGLEALGSENWYHRCVSPAPTSDQAKRLGDRGQNSGEGQTIGVTPAHLRKAFTARA
jgi:hypothetical protein